MRSLDDSVQFLKGVGPQRSKLFLRLGINTVSDLLAYIPRKYLDRSQIKSIKESLASINPDEEVTLKGTITAVRLHLPKYHKTIFEVVLSDSTGHISATWFNQPYLQTVFAKGQEVILSGKIKFYKYPQLSSPEYEFISGDNFAPLHSQGIIPCYPLTEGLTQKFLRRIIRYCLDNYISLVQDNLGSALKVKHNLLELPEAIRQIHYPDSAEQMAKARVRLVYDELLLFQLSLGLRRQQIKQTAVKYPIAISEQLEERIRKRIPFQLTRAQEKVIAEIRQDITRNYPMNRLLQGDVGSGKTIVAIYAILATIGNGLQTAFMAPTEILAEQHFRNLSHLLADSQVRMVLLKSGLGTAERRKIRGLIEAGEVDLVIGTHALIQKDVVFRKLGLLVIDEQHKFGVMQRADLREKGENPHTLIMTATPIPRTLALTAFGDLDISTIDELPPGRQPIRTVLRPSNKMPDAFGFIREKIRAGRQVYFVYPLIEDIEEIDSKTAQRQLYKVNLKSATTMAKYLKEQVFPECTVALLHGDMKDARKEKIMADFRAGKTDILVSTVVIEVGIDVANASVMVIEHAERYGLAQLHQLRGRIGRGAHQSYCLLFGDFTTPEAEQRLKIMEETSDGFRIAEEDLRIRGPGEFLGTRQSGLPEFRVANLATDFGVLKLTQTDAKEILDRDPFLDQPDNRRWRQEIKNHFSNIVTMP
ncbi:MAG: ATP-dependent DNA helicase RecG [Planctomycetes bacterium]|nr:ATP-dependent DNA helicase RecG [Planctomycetota bacterium]